MWVLPGSIPEEEAPEVTNAEGLIGVGKEISDPLHFSDLRINPRAFHPRFSKHFVDVKIIYCHISNGETMADPKTKCRNMG